MCEQCNYREMLEDSGLEANANRLRVLGIVGDNNYPLTASEVYTTIARSHAINRVTVYRILDTLVEHRVIEKISTGGRAAHYGIAPNKHHAPHPHFYCTSCGLMDCLRPESLTVNSDNLYKTFPGVVEKIEIRVEGLCRSCAKQKDKLG